MSNDTSLFGVLELLVWVTVLPLVVVLVWRSRRSHDHETGHERDHDQPDDRQPPGQT